MARDVTVPDIGDFEGVPVIEILVAAGDEVAVEQPLVTLESDKATMDVPAPFAGKVAELKVSVGDEVSEGSVLMTVEASAATRRRAASADAERRAPTLVEAVTASRGQRGRPRPLRRPRPQRPPSPNDGKPDIVSGKRDARQDGAGDGPVYASPAVRRMAREMGVGLQGVQGSGRKGRITKDDVKQAKERPAAAPGEGAAIPGLNLAPWPKVDFAKYGEIERVPLSRIKKISGPNVARNWVDDSARHPQRRGGHHRPRGVPQADQCRAAGREGDDGRAPGEGLRRLAASSSRTSTRRSTVTSW